MLELATINSVAELFKQFLGFRETEKVSRRKLFEQLVVPLFSELELVAKDYHSAISEVRNGLRSEDPDLPKIRDQLQRRRQLIVLAKMRIIGIGHAFGVTTVYYESHPLSKQKGEFWMELQNFGAAVTTYFDFSDHIYGPTKYHESPISQSIKKRFPERRRVSGHSALTAHLDGIMKTISQTPPDQHGRYLEDLRHTALAASDGLESRWGVIASIYGQLKLISER
jgi:hypothetical protein